MALKQVYKNTLKSLALTTKHWSLSHTRWSVQVKTEVSNEKAGGSTPIRRMCETQRERERRPVWWWMGGEAVRWGCCCNHQLERVAMGGGIQRGPQRAAGHTSLCYTDPVLPTGPWAAFSCCHQDWATQTYTRTHAHTHTHTHTHTRTHTRTHIILIKITAI